MENFYILIDDKARKICCDAVKTAPENYIVEIKARNRTVEQNRLYWALCHAVSEQYTEDGKFYKADIWHELFKKAFVPGRVEILPDKTELIMYKSTTKLTVTEFSNLIENVKEFCRDNKINIDEIISEMPYAFGEFS
mgnify:FL=1|tara:strand:+ start:570 stop:980 length:411 start_codon:yes stop_codon:yes gene_type:complete